MKTSQTPVPLFQKSDVLFGHAGAPGLIDVEIDGNNKVKLFSRDGDMTSSETVPFEPFILLAGAGGLTGWHGETRIEVLDGHGAFLQIGNRLRCRETGENVDMPRQSSASCMTNRPWIKLEQTRGKKLR